MTMTATVLVFMAMGLVLAFDISDRSKASLIPGKSSTGSEEAKASKSLNLKGNPGQPNASVPGNYDCRLRVYVNEPSSRWTDNSNFYHYEFGFLDFAFDTILSLGYLETYSETKTWTAPAPYTDITELNIAATAAVFNLNESHQAYSNPPSGSPFTAYYVDASAIARPGHPGSDSSDAGSTHSVFIEEATATW
jgi:hypothetical protein